MEKVRSIVRRNHGEHEVHMSRAARACSYMHVFLFYQDARLGVPSRISPLLRHDCLNYRDLRLMEFDLPRCEFLGWIGMPMIGVGGCGIYIFTVLLRERDYVSLELRPPMVSFS